MFVTGVCEKNARRQFRRIGASSPAPPSSMLSWLRGVYRALRKKRPPPHGHASHPMPNIEVGGGGVIELCALRFRRGRFFRRHRNAFSIVLNVGAGICGSILGGSCWTTFWQRLGRGGTLQASRKGVRCRNCANVEAGRQPGETMQNRGGESAAGTWSNRSAWVQLAIHAHGLATVSYSRRPVCSNVSTISWFLCLRKN